MVFANILAHAFGNSINAVFSRANRGGGGGNFSTGRNPDGDWGMGGGAGEKIWSGRRGRIDRDGCCLD